MSKPPWCRLYSEVLSDRKIEYICRQTQQPKMVILGTWSIFLALANDSPQRGTLLLTEDISYSRADLIAEMGAEPATGMEIITAFMEVGLLTYEDNVLRITNFNKRNFTSDKWRAKRVVILARDKSICQYCGAFAEHVDHIIPRCQGGTDDLSNLVAACAHCNMSKGGRTPEQAGMELGE